MNPLEEPRAVESPQYHAGFENRLALTLTGFVICAIGWWWIGSATDTYTEDTYSAAVPALEISLILAGPALCCALLALSWGRRWPLMTWVGLSVVAVVLVMVPWHPRKRFRNELRFILMSSLTKEEVRQRMSPYREIPSTVTEANGNGSLFFRWNEAGEAPGGMGEVRFVNGRSAGTHFYRGE